MDTLFAATWFIVLCLGLAFLTETIRRLIEIGFAKWSFVKNGSPIWKDIILPSLPGVIGILFTSFAAKYPYPDSITALSARMMFGLAAGLLSALVYRVVKVLVINKVPVDQQKDLSVEK